MLLLLCHFRTRRVREDDLDHDPRELQRKRSSIEFRPFDTPKIPSQLDAPVSRLQSTGPVFSAVRRFTPTVSRVNSDSTNNVGEDFLSKPHSLFWRNFGGGGVPNQVDRPSHQRHVTLRASSSLGVSDNDDSLVREVDCLSYSQVHSLNRTINHPAWKNTTLFFILLILFGPAIRDIWLPKTADGAIDGLFTIAFAFLAVDIIIRCIVDRAYFSWNVKSRDSTKNCHMGSFMFWIDTVRIHIVTYSLRNSHITSSA